MRLKRGSSINLFNKEGEWRCEIIFLDKDRVEVKFLEKIKQANDLSKIDSSVVSSAMDSWAAYWKFPAIMAGVIAVIFFVSFRDKVSMTSEEEGSED